MGKGSWKKIVFVSSYPPRRCGIATFTSDLISSISLAGRENFEPLVVAMQTGEQGYSEPVKFEISTGGQKRLYQRGRLHKFQPR